MSSVKTKVRSEAPETYLYIFVLSELDAFKLTFDGQDCITGTVVELTDTSNRLFKWVASFQSYGNSKMDMPDIEWRTPRL